MKKIIIIFIISLAFFGCASTAPSVDVFYVEKGVMQYFANPTFVSGPAGKCLMDFTFRYGEGVTTPVICNFTLSTKYIRSMNMKAKVYFKNDYGTIYPLVLQDILFLEKSRNRIRYTTQIEREIFFELLKVENPVLIIEAENNFLVFDSNKNLVKMFEHVQFELF